MHHAEGDVATHTRMACEALAALPAWRERPAEERTRLFAAALLHDVAKPDCTQVEEDGRITAHGHSRRGDLVARRVLWEAGVPIAWREHVAALIRHHQVPFWALERPRGDLDRIIHRVSLLARNDDLGLLATADILGRTCADATEMLDNVALFLQYTSRRRLPRPASVLPVGPRQVHVFPASRPGRGLRGVRRHQGHRDRHVRAAGVGERSLDRRTPAGRARRQPRRLARTAADQAHRRPGPGDRRRDRPGQGAAAGRHAVRLERRRT